MKINYTDFMSGLEIQPKFKGTDIGDGVIISEWDVIENKFPSLEFGTEETKYGQCLYYEIVDFGNGYSEGDVIRINDDIRRTDVLNTRLTSDNLMEVQKHINESLKRFYGRK